MARRGWSATNYLLYTTGIVTAMPLTIAAWGKTSITGTLQAMVHIGDVDVNPTQNRWSLTVDVNDKVTATTNTTSGTVSAVTSTAISANTWFHACAVFTSATSRGAYLNGGGKGSNTTSRSPTGIDRTAIGVLFGSSVSQPFGPAGTGDLAEVAVWNIALSDADVAALATGVSPLLIHPEALVGYWPLLGVNSPENNLLSNTSTMSITGSLSQSAHPRVFEWAASKIGISTNIAYEVAAAVGSFALTGYATLVGLMQQAAQGAYALTGQAATLGWNRFMAAAQGAYALTGQAVTFLVGTGLNLIASTGYYVVSSVGAALRWLLGHPIRATRAPRELAETRTAAPSLSDRRSVLSRLRKTRNSDPSL